MCKVENIKKGKRNKKVVEVRSRGSKSKVESEEILELNSEGDICEAERKKWSKNRH